MAGHSSPLVIVLFLCRHDNCRGIKICPCLSVLLSVHPSVTLYGVEFVYSNSPTVFRRSFKPCTFVVDIIRMYIWDFDIARINFERIMAFQTKSF